jgi:hypothetical protein
MVPRERRHTDDVAVGGVEAFNVQRCSLALQWVDRG